MGAKEVIDLENIFWNTCAFVIDSMESGRDKCIKCATDHASGRSLDVCESDFNCNIFRFRRYYSIESWCLTSIKYSFIVTNLFLVLGSSKSSKDIVLIKNTSFPKRPGFHSPCFISI